MLRIADLYDQLVTELNIPAQILITEKEKVLTHLKSLPTSQKNEIELYVRRVQTQNALKATPSVQVLTLVDKEADSLYLGSDFSLRVNFINITTCSLDD